MEVKTVFVTSTNRDLAKDPYGNSYTLYLSTPIKDITNVEILYASVPNTMYNLTNGLDVIQFNSNTYSLSEGFYNSTGLANEIECAECCIDHVQVQYLQNEGKYLFSSKCNTFTMNVLSKEVASMVGLPWNQEVAAVTTHCLPFPARCHSRYANKWFIKSFDIIDLNINEGVFLDIHELRTNFNECAAFGRPFSDSSSLTASRSFGFIPMNVASSCIKVFTPGTDFENKVDYVYPIQKLDRLTIRWTDKSGQLLNFNGMNDNSIILKFHTLRKNLRG